MVPYLMWDEDKRVEVTSLDELDQSLDRLMALGVQSDPFSVEFQVNDSTCIVLTVGRPESHLEFYDAQARPPAVGCSGPWEDDDLIVFFHHGHYSELPRRFFVPVEDARAAVRSYFTIGNRPATIRW